VSARTHARLRSQAASAILFGLAAAAAIFLGRPRAILASRPFERFAPALAARATADAFGRSGGVKMRVALPEDSVEFPLGLSADPSTVRYQWVRLADSTAATEPRALAGAHVVAPTVPGFYRLALLRGETREVLAEPALGVMVPFEAKRGGMLNGYRIGTYLAERLGVGYERPEGFLEVQPDEVELRVSNHLRLADFLTQDSQREVWPKYVALSPRLLDKLELVIDEVERGRRPGRDLEFGVHSGFRTPAHNGRVRRAAQDSRHQYGDAADVVIDANGDGRITAADGLLVARAVEQVERDNPDLVGGLGLYFGRQHRTPYVHIDTRGKRSRWRG
jgi:uncharacterized protein YcbK (DUF882 family)